MFFLVKEYRRKERVMFALYALSEKTVDIVSIIRKYALAVLAKNTLTWYDYAVSNGRTLTYTASYS